MYCEVDMKSTNKKRRYLIAGFIVLMLLMMFCVAFAEEEAAEEVIGASKTFYKTAWALLPPVIAIALALITKEVYSSLFIGIVVGGLLYSNFSFEGTLNHVFNDGIVAVLSDS